MTGHKIITIGREFGSGGHEIGQKLADRLEIPLYDHRLVSMAAEELGVKTEDAERVDESSLNTFVAGYTMTPGMYTDFINAASYIPSFDTDVYRKQTEIIRSLAQKGPCVIVGRCGDYILRDFEPFRIFVYADLESRMERCRAKAPEDEKMTDRELKQHILGIDRKRAKYYEFYTGHKWGDRLNFDLCINTSRTVIKEIVPVLARLFEE